MSVHHNWLAALALVAALAPGGCAAPAASTPAKEEATVLTVATHDSFAIGEAIVAQFEADHNAKVQFLTLGDAGEALNKIIISKDAPLADVFYGVDNTFLSRALGSGVFESYASPQLATIPAGLRLDPESRLLPADYGWVTLNADAGWFEEKGLAMPATIEALADPAYKGLLVVENPATSSPGLAFLLATIDHFGVDGWQQFWQALRANGVQVADGWTQAYYDDFTVGSAGLGDRPLAVSYTTSPAADVLFASDGRSEPASVNLNLDGGVFRQVEFVGLLAGAKEPELARAWIDYMLSKPMQEDLPLQMFVYPAQPDAALPELFVRFATTPADVPQPDAATIDANRDEWIKEWTEIMLR